MPLHSNLGGKSKTFSIGAVDIKASRAAACRGRGGGPAAEGGAERRHDRPTDLGVGEAGTPRPLSPGPLGPGPPSAMGDVLKLLYPPAPAPAPATTVAPGAGAARGPPRRERRGEAEAEVGKEVEVKVEEVEEVKVEEEVEEVVICKLERAVEAAEGRDAAAGSGLG